MNADFYSRRRQRQSSIVNLSRSVMLRARSEQSRTDSQLLGPVIPSKKTTSLYILFILPKNNGQFQGQRSALAPDGRGAKSDALVAQCPSSAPELASLSETWPPLPQHIRQAIQTLVHSV